MWERKERAWERRRLNRGPWTERSMPRWQKLNIIDGLGETISRPNILTIVTIFAQVWIKYWAKFQAPETFLRLEIQKRIQKLATPTLRLGLSTLVWRYSEARVIFPSLFSDCAHQKTVCAGVGPYECEWGACVSSASACVWVRVCVSVCWVFRS